MPVSGERIVPPIIAAMPTIAHRPASPTGSHWPTSAPSAPPMISNGASTPPDVPEPSAIDQTSALPTSKTDQRRAEHFAAQQAVDQFIADAEHARIDPAADADEDRADRRPPHPVNRQLLRTHLRRHRPAPSANPNRTRPAMPTTQPASHRPTTERAHAPRPGKSGPRPSNGTRSSRRDDRGDGHRNETARLPFEQQQLDREQTRRDRRGEDRRHARRRAGHEQRLALRRGEMKQLREERTERAARHDDRTFRAERTAGADRDRRRDRLEDRDLRLDQAAAEQNRFERFGNAVAANFLRAVARHQPDDQRADDRHRNDPRAEMMMLQRFHLRREALEENDVGDHRDEPEQRLGDKRADDADRQRERNEQQHPRIGAEIAQHCFGCFDSGHEATRWGRAL